MANLDPSREYRLIESIRPLCGSSEKRWEKGIGDDCAVRYTSSQRLLLTADTMVENVHFRTDLMTLKEIGFKSIAGSVSDVYAMGGVPESVAINLVFPKSACSSELIEQLYEGIGEAVTLFNTPVIGGDMTSGPCWVIAVTVLGDAGNSIVYRNGAQVGDSIWVSGTPGLSGLGFDLLVAYGNDRAKSIDPEAVEAHIRPIPRHTIAQYIQKNPAIHSMIDISDGVAKESLTIAQESIVGVEIQLPETIRSRLEQNRDYQSKIRPAKELFLSGGEDYELLFTCSAEFVPTFEGIQFTRIGTVTESTDSFYIDTECKSELRGGWDHL